MELKEKYNTEVLEKYAEIIRDYLQIIMHKDECIAQFKDSIEDRKFLQQDTKDLMLGYKKLYQEEINK